MAMPEVFAWSARIALMALSLSLLGALRYCWRGQLFGLRHQLELQRQLIDVSGEAMLLADEQGTILAVNPAFERITGYRQDEVLGQPTDFLFAGWQSEGLRETLCQQVGRDGHWSGEVWNRSKQGEVYLQQLTVRRIELAGAAARHVAVFSDISLQKAQAARIEYLAHHDPLTGLLNRSALGNCVDEAIARARREGGLMALLLVDLDNFKTINDSLGHLAGDRLLCDVARRLLGQVGERGRLIRQGGDEFVFVLSGLSDAAQAAGLAETLLRLFDQPFALDGHELHTSLSIGISLFPVDGETPEILLRHADAAMYHAKAGGRNTYRFFAPPMSAAASHRLQLESELWQALAANQLLLHYQPQVDLPSGRIVGVEALVRWHHPVRGMIAPSDFIPVAEESGLIIPLGLWVLHTACRQAREWLDQGLDMGEMAVNISAHQFRQSDFVASVRRALSDTGLPAGCLELEITETAVMHSADSSVSTLAELKAMGVKLAIDDFGTGYSSLAYLRRFPIDRLKIDRAFVADLASDPDAASLVASIIALGRSLGLRLVAEGVETPEQADFLREMACERVQGFHFYRPVAADQVGLPAVLEAQAAF